MPGAVPSDLLAKEQQFISAGLEGERVMMMFISIVVVSLMILTYLAFHRYPSFLFLSSDPTPSSLAGAEYSCLESMTADMVFQTLIVVCTHTRRHASAIISVSSLAAAYPWTGGSAPQYPTGVASSPGPSGKDFYRREMDQRLYSKMV
jgi:hypothetical protein